MESASTTRAPIRKILAFVADYCMLSLQFGLTAYLVPTTKIGVVYTLMLILYMLVLLPEFIISYCNMIYQKYYHSRTKLKLLIRHLLSINMMSGYAQLTLCISAQIILAVKFKEAKKMMGILALHLIMVGFLGSKRLVNASYIKRFMIQDSLRTLPMTMLRESHIRETELQSIPEVHEIDSIEEMENEAVAQYEEEKSTEPEYYEEVDSKNISAEETCIICFEDLRNKTVVKLSCNEKHYFHKDCIKLWMTKNQNCPVCRTRFENDHNINYSSDIEEFEYGPTIMNPRLIGRLTRIMQRRHRRDNFRRIRFDLAPLNNINIHILQEETSNILENLSRMTEQLEQNRQMVQLAINNLRSQRNNASS